MGDNKCNSFIFSQQRKNPISYFLYQAMTYEKSVKALYTEWLFQIYTHKISKLKLQENQSKNFLPSTSKNINKKS